MNANELADALQGSCPYGLDEAARMLRQQQELLNYASSNDRYQKQVIKELEAKIEALKERKEHWENQYIIENKKWQFAEKSFSDLLMRTVNNSHPAKTLTDEEIDELADKFLSVYLEYGIDPYVLGDREFARAILRKANEK